MTDAAVRFPALAFDQGPAATVGTARPRLSPGALLVSDVAAAALATVGVVGAGWVASPTIVVLLLAVAGWGTCLATSRALTPAWMESRALWCRRVVRAGCALALAGTGASLVLPRLTTAHDVFVLAGCWTALSCGLRLTVPSLGAGRTRAPLAVVGGSAHDRHVLAMLEQRAGGAVPVVRLTHGEPDPHFDGGPVLRVEDVAHFAAQAEAGAVVAIPGPGLDASTLRRLQWELEGGPLPLYIDPGILGVSSARLVPSAAGHLALVRVDATNRHGFSWEAIGWGGRVAAAAGLLALLPVLALIALAIRSTTPGPAIYRQVRVGRGGETFTILKFRTMVAEPCTSQFQSDFESDFDDILFKMRQDPRVTPLGRWLRRYSLDELPQLANVALGQMRLIGPRPALPEEVDAYPPDARRRLAVKPGITGLWQVSGRSDLSWEETVRLDLHYVDNWSPWLDLAILCRTARAVVGHRGAY